MAFDGFGERRQRLDSRPEPQFVDRHGRRETKDAGDRLTAAP